MDYYPTQFGTDWSGKLFQIQTEHAADPAGFGTMPTVHHPFVGGGEDITALVAVLNPFTGQIVAFQRTIGFVLLLWVTDLAGLGDFDFYFCWF